MTPNTVQPITDEQLAEMELRCREMQRDGGAILMSEEWLSGLIARLRAAEKDQARYLWLRNPDQDVSLVLDKVIGHKPLDEFGGGGYALYEYRAGEELDEAIDAAMHQG
jgi:hypothetical protein